MRVTVSVPEALNIGRVLSVDDLNNIETYMAGKAGISL